MEIGDEAAHDPLDQLLQQLDMSEQAQGGWGIGTPAVGSLAVVPSRPMMLSGPADGRGQQPLLQGSPRLAAGSLQPDPTSPPSYRQHHLDWLLASGDISPSAWCPAASQQRGSPRVADPQPGALAFIDIDHKPVCAPDVAGRGSSLQAVTSNLSGGWSLMKMSV
jgi:hypothetical protein